MSQQDQSNTEQLLVAQSLSASVANVGLQGNGSFAVSSSPTTTTDAKTVEKKSDEPPKIKRPMNPFMIFGCEKRRKLAQVHPRMHNSEISKILGAEWKRMNEYEKAPYVQEAKRLKEQHSIEYPNYKFKANRRKPRQAVKKERPPFPYATDLNTIPSAMKFPYPTAFFQDSMYGSIYPAMASSSHPAYPMYSDYSSLSRQAMSGGGVRGAQPSSTTPSAVDYYSTLKGSVTPVNDYYGVVNKSSEYYSAMHAATNARTAGDRSPVTPGEVGNLSDRYPSADNRQFENRYASPFNGSQTGGSSVAPYTTIQNMSHLTSNEAPVAYSYSSMYDQRH